jgi:hypothetical protein
MFRDLLLHFNYRWNVRCGVRSRGEKDFSTYSHWILEAAWQRSRGRVPAGVDFLPGFAPAITRDAAEAQGIDVDSIGFNLAPCEAPPRCGTDACGDCNSGEDEEQHEIGSEVAGLFAGAHGGRDEEVFPDHADDDESESEIESDDGLDLDDDEERDIGTAINHVDLSKLQKATAGDGPQSAVLAMTPVSNISELNLLVRLVETHVTNTSSRNKSKNRAKKRSLDNSIAVDYVTLAAAFNASVLSAFSANPTDFNLTGLRLKSPAHLKDFLERADEAFVIAHSVAGVRTKLIDVRQRLRDCTSAVIPAAQTVTTLSSGDACEVLPAGTTTVAPRRAPRTCPECKGAKRNTQGHSYRRIGNGAGGVPVRYICSHPACGKYEAPGAGSVEGKRKREPPRCKDCGHPLSQSGTRENTRRFCTEVSSCAFFKGLVSR